MKFKFFIIAFISFCFLQVAFGGGGTFPSGANIKMLKSNLLFKGGNVRIMTNDTDDPSSVAKTADEGSLYIQNGTGVLFQKQDAGPSTNWSPLLIGPAAAVTDECVARWDGTVGVLQDSVFCITDVGIITGATQLNVDNLRLDGNTLSSTDVNGNIILNPNGTGNFQLPDLTASRPLKLDASNNVVATQIDLASTSDVTGVLPVANGGTNSSTALNNDRLLITNTGAIKEFGAMTDGQIVIGQTAAAPLAAVLSSEATMDATGAVTLDNNSVTGKVLTGFTSGAGALAATDTILEAVQKLDGNIVNKLDSSLTDTNIFVGNGSNVATGVAMSGEASIANTGAITLDNDSVVNKLLARIGTPTFPSIQDLQNIFHSVGRADGGIITDGGGGSADIAAGTGYIRASDSEIVDLLVFDWVASPGLSLTDNQLNYIYVEYNAGSPLVIATTSKRTDLNTNVWIGTVTREGPTLHISNATEIKVSNHAALMGRRLIETQDFARVSGGTLGETGTRNITVSAGTWWQGLTSFTTAAVDTSATGTFDRFYRDGSGGFTIVATQTQYNNTQWDDGDGGLATLTNNRYAVSWWYIEQDGDVATVMGRGDYTLSQAQDANEPGDLPIRLTNHGRLIGKLIVQKSDGTAFSIESVFERAFERNPVTDHPSLTELGADSHPQYVLLAGRAGGQTLIGGTAASDDLTFQTTSDGTKGDYIFSELSGGACYLSTTNTLENRVLTDGQLLIGSTGLDPVAATLTATANQTTIAVGAGILTIGTVQDINTTSNVQFGSVSTNNQGNLFLEEGGGGTDTVGMQAPAALAASYVLTWPVDNGTSNQVLTTDGAGVLSWASAAAPSFSTVVKDVSYTILDGDGFTHIATESTASTRVMTLPTLAANIDRQICFKNFSTQKGIMRIDGESTETIDGIQTIDLDFKGAEMCIIGMTNGWRIVSDNLTSIRKTYTLTVTGSNWTSDGDGTVGRPYKDIDGRWHLRGNIVGSFVTTTTSSFQLAISGITTKLVGGDNNFAVTVYDLSTQTRSSDQFHSAYMLDNDNRIFVVISSSINVANIWGFAFDFPLASKPTFVE